MAGSTINCGFRSSGAAPAAACVSSAVHVLFEIAGTRRLSLPDLASPYEGVVYLGHRILANRTDLRCHAQRILLLVEAGNVPALQGALVDLFIALGDKGSGLKGRLLDLAAPKLPRTAVAFFGQRLLTGIKPWEAAVSRTRSSLLSFGYSGVPEVVRRLDPVKPSGFGNVLDEALACLEYGQVDVASEVLEQALRKEPNNEPVAAQLLEIYRHTRDDERIVTMCQFLSTALPRLPAPWQAEYRRLMPRFVQDRPLASPAPRRSLVIRVRHD